MNIVVKRITLGKNYTEGKMYIDGVYVADTLEDTDRGLSQTMKVAEVRKRKIPKATAIPIGTYKVSLNIKTMYAFLPAKPHRHWYQQTALKGVMPYVCGTPGFDGILIHTGTSVDWTDGCVLIGVKKGNGTFKNNESKETVRKVYKIFALAKAKGEKLIMTIEYGKDDGTPINNNLPAGVPVEEVGPTSTTNATGILPEVSGDSNGTIRQPQTYKKR